MSSDELWIVLTTFFSSVLFFIVLALLCFFTCRLASKVKPLGTPMRF